MGNKPKNIKVSVLMMAYNHEPFIAQAIESALAQETRFDYEVVIGEDCSTDRTREIVIGFQQRYPEKVRALLPEKNLGPHENFAQTLGACRGQYIALLEGDDYWTSSEKLQKQADFLDSHAECAICFHNANVVHEDGLRPRSLACDQNQKKLSFARDLLAGNHIPTCSAMFRNGLIGEMPAWVSTLRMGDWPLHLLNAQHGAIGYLKDVMATYRIHQAGAWSRLLGDPIGRNLEEIGVYETFCMHFPEIWRTEIRRQIAIRLYRIAIHAYDSADLENARSYARKSVAASRRLSMSQIFLLTKLFAKLYVPGVSHLSRQVRHHRAERGLLPD